MPSDHDSLALYLEVARQELRDRPGGYGGLGLLIDDVRAELDGELVAVRFSLRRSGCNAIEMVIGAHLPYSSVGAEDLRRDLYILTTEEDARTRWVPDDSPTTERDALATTPQPVVPLRRTDRVTYRSSSTAI